MNGTPALLWFRHDLRLEDHPALTAAALHDGPVIPVFIAPDGGEVPCEPGAASRWWLHHSLRALENALHRRYRARLVLRHGPPPDALRQLIRETGARALFFNRRYEPAAREHDEPIQRQLESEGVAMRTFNGSLLVEPASFLNKSGKPFQVFTPFWKAAAAQIEIPSPVASPERLPVPAQWPDSVEIDALGLEPSPDWAGGLRGAWQPGESGAKQALRRFLDDTLAGYPESRDRPDILGTSRLSPHLHFGEISPRTVFHAVQRTGALRPGVGLVRGAEAFLRQVYWREFAHYLLHHFPHTPVAPLQSAFAKFPWRKDPEALRAWRRGQTGYPIVDAGMRELWNTGWMHNRVRMIAASFLVKDLLIHWHEGARWFWDTLVDADLANNTLGWQWVAGCGADAAPYFRIFNPVLQGRKFDPEGSYVKRWVPELAALPAKYIHAPWEAPAAALRATGVSLGETYPAPIVDHGEARARALAAYARIKGR